jgi:Replication-relaxation
MTQNPMSPVDPSRPGAWPHAARLEISASPARPLSPTDRQLLVLLGEHQVLTTSQLVRITSRPERTVQHRLGVLHRIGLINRVRPPADVGTAAFHCWLTIFGAGAVDADAHEPWSEDLAGVRAKVALTELWLSVRDNGQPGGLDLQGWRRLSCGVSYLDLRTNAPSALPVEAELIVALDSHDGPQVTILAVATVEGVSKARLASVLARYAGYVAACCPNEQRPVLVVLVRTPRHADSVLAVAEQLPEATSLRHLDRVSAEEAIRSVAVGVSVPRPDAFATEPVWCTPGDHRARRLVDVLVEIAAGSR